MAETTQLTLRLPRSFVDSVDDFVKDFNEQHGHQRTTDRSEILRRAVSLWLDIGKDCQLVLMAFAEGVKIDSFPDVVRYALAESLLSEKQRAQIETHKSIELIANIGRKQE